MNSIREKRTWGEVKTIFWQALEHASGTRAAFLDRACSGNPDVRAEVESLIRAHETTVDFMEPPRFGAVSDLLSDNPGGDPLIGQRLGSYQVEELIASGGMGSVYRAVRADDQFHATVAIKVIRRGAASPEAIRRFHQERQTLANLKHPNIAHLYDGGMTETGLPYQVMEYVAGRPITEYSDLNHLSITARLRLFSAACAAVQYAHQNLVVHRDLKPGNILVTADSTPKLVDFGIAKILEGPTTSGTATVERAMTPDYASPEQIRGQRATTATDVYSLGVVLYELLTGTRPYRQTGSFYDLQRAICEQEPQRPSTAIKRAMGRPQPSTAARPPDFNLDRLRRRLAGDLDAIVLKALRKEPQLRYPTVEAFAEDIRRHLDGQPVVAREGGVAYYTLKFIRRNFAAALAAVVVLASLVFATVATWRSAEVTRRERDAALIAHRRAQEEAENARVEMRKALKTTGFLQKVIGSADPARLGRNVSILEVLEHAARTVETDFPDDPEVHSAVYTAIGQSYMGLGRYDEAEKHLRTALDIQLGIHGKIDHADVAQHFNNLGIVLHAKGDLAGARQLFERSLEMHGRLYGDSSPDAATDLNNLGVIARATGDLDSAERLLNQALDIRLARLGHEHADVAEALNNLANVRRQRGDTAGAIDLCREVLELRRRLLGEKHPLYAQSLANLAVLATAGEPDAAEPLFKEAIALSREVLGEDHPDLATTLVSYGSMLFHYGRSAEAEPLLTEALSIRCAAFPPGHYRIASVEAILGRVLVRLQCYAEAHPHLAASLEPLRAANVAQELAPTLEAMITACEKLNRPGEAAEYRTLLAHIHATPARS